MYHFFINLLAVEGAIGVLLFALLRIELADFILGVTPCASTTGFKAGLETGVTVLDLDKFLTELDDNGLTQQTRNIKNNTLQK